MLETIVAVAAGAALATGTAGLSTGVKKWAKNTLKKMNDQQD